jgi:hypothetical protein
MVTASLREELVEELVFVFRLEERAPREEGIDPDRELSFRRNSTTDPSWPKEEGIGPVKSLFPRFRTVRDERRLSSGVILPLKWFPLRSKYSSKVRLPISEGKRRRPVR